MLKKKPSFDTLLKSTIVFVLMVLSIIGIVFGSLRLADSANRGAFYDGTISTTVYFSAYEPADSSQRVKDQDFTKERNTTDTKLIPNIQEMLDQISNTYANRLYLQGFNQVVISSNQADANASNLVDQNLIKKSWLINQNALPSITVTVNKLNPQDREELYYTQKILRQTTFEINRSFDLTLESTDGYQIFSSSGIANQPVQPIRFIPGSASATRPAASSTDSSITLELNIPGVTLNSENNTALNYFDQAIENINKESDYISGNGQASVEGNNSLFNSGANGSTAQGNRNLILWSDKEGALAYVRHIFNVDEGSREYFSFSEKEQNLWKFLHRKSPYDGSEESSKDTSLIKAFSSADEIQLKDLYYIYAKPNAYEAKSDSDNSSPSTITSPSETRTSRGAPNDYSSLFAPYILYEARTINPDATQNDTLTNLFPKEQTFNHGGNNKLVLKEILDDTGSYANVSFANASRIANLINSGNFNNNVALIGSNSIANDPILSDTFMQIDAFATSIIALSAFVLLVGIIVSILYKIPGLFSFLPILLGAVLSLLLYNEFGGIIDLFTLLGLIGLITIGIGCLLLIFESIRRNIRNSTSITEAVRLAYNHTFMKIVDIHLLTLVLGLFLMYVGHYQESSFGILMIVGSFVSFFVVYGSSTIYVKLFVSIKNWTTYGLFVYKRDTKWLNQITGQLNLQNDDHLILNRSISSNVDDELHNLFKQNFRNFFFNPKSLWALLTWLIVVIVGIVSLVLFSLNLVWPLDASVQNSGLIMFISIFGSMGVMAIYFALRYRWIVLIPYIVSSIINFFLIVSILLVFSPLLINTIQFEAVFVLLISWILTQIAFIFSISWNYSYWYHYVVYKKESIVKLINNNIFTSIRLFVIFGSIFPLGVLLISLFNIGGNGSFISQDLNLFLLTLFGLSSVALLFSLMIANYLFSQLLGLMILLRQNMISNNKKKLQIQFKEDKDYDRFDEQIIPGINERLIERRY
ncbi:MPN396 family protein [Mycoplasmoides pirum]|uniref:MPN396 family protein n=1 Tax=Mycoplasmoides pirum TaxID=2122 RepID=UPI000486FC07|nr:hypothetical protein [Mycoplasmoides pirum]